ncbi:hypothetical protein [Methylobacterium sp. WSM2598]|uniref:hypothetical protein n=1 Tax=Methylobacterium sp. WSM2598 TaxID=398261 RepID=UPI0012F66E8A|nr:hypothetical protein [Methylobacterium sp. WSM2598]
MLTCYPYFGVDAQWGSRLPPEVFFRAIAKAGEMVTGQPAAALEAASRRCYRRALATPNDYDNVEVPGARVWCSTDRDNPYFSVDIRRPQGK